MVGEQSTLLVHGRAGSILRSHYPELVSGYFERVTVNLIRCAITPSARRQSGQLQQAQPGR